MATRNSSLDYRRLLYLNKKLKNGTATQQEKDELINMLHRTGSVSDTQYRNYKSGNNPEEILNAVLIIAGIVLLGYILSQMAKD